MIHLPRFGRLSAWLVVVLALFLAPRGFGDERRLSKSYSSVPWPPHPTVIFAKYKGQRLQVIAAEKNRPVVMIDGTRQALPETTKLVTQRAPAYSPLEARFRGGFGAGQTVYTPTTPSGKPIQSQYFAGYLETTPVQGARDCFLLIVSFDAEVFRDPDIDDLCKMSVQEVGDLAAGIQKTTTFNTTVVFPLRYSNGNPFEKNPSYMTMMPVFWKLFSAGAEVKSEDLPGLGMFYYLHERVDHDSAVTAWKKANRSGDHPAQAYVQTPLLGMGPSSLPADVTATLTVSSDGVVKEVVLDQPYQEAVAKRLNSNLKLWMFLPEIKNGKAVSAKIKVPLAF